MVPGLSSVVERSPDAAVPPDGDEHEVEDADGAGEDVTGLVEDAPEGGHGPGPSDEGGGPEGHDDGAYEEVGESEGEEKVIGGAVKVPDKHIMIITSGYHHHSVTDSFKLTSPDQDH